MTTTVQAATKAYNIQRPAIVIDAARSLIRDRLSRLWGHGEVTALIQKEFSYTKGVAQKMVRSEWEEIRSEFHARDRGQIQARLVKAFEAIHDGAFLDKQFAAATGAVREIGKMTGVYAPEQIQVQASVGIEIAKLSDAERRTLRELLVKAKRS